VHTAEDDEFDDLDAVAYARAIAKRLGALVLLSRQLDCRLLIGSSHDTPLHFTPLDVAAFRHTEREAVGDGAGGRRRRRHR
jgi:hypothetical protein